MKPPPDFSLSGEIKLRRSGTGGGDIRSGMAERRRKARISQPFPTRAWGTDTEGQSFEVDCALDNISSSGLYLRMAPQMKSGTELNVVVKFLSDENAGPTALLVCEVLRAEDQPDGQHGFAMAIKAHHFLAAQSQAADAAN